MESIAGAILTDTKLNLDLVWKVFNPLLSPIVTPDKLELPPLRELNQLCDSLGYFVKENCEKKGSNSIERVELSVQLPDALLVQEGKGPNKKSAKGDAAFHLLKELEVCCSFLNEFWNFSFPPRIVLSFSKFMYMYTFALSIQYRSSQSWVSEDFI